MKPELKWWL